MKEIHDPPFQFRLQACTVALKLVLSAQSPAPVTSRNVEDGGGALTTKTKKMDSAYV